MVIGTPILLAGIHLAWAPDRRRALGQIGIMAATAAALGLAVGGYFLAVGRFTDFYNVMIIHNRFYAGNMAANLLQGLQADHLVPSYMEPLTPLAVLGAFGLALGLLKTGRRPWALLAGLIIGTEIAIAMPGRFFRHYYQFWLPPLAVAAGWALQELGQLARKDEDSRAYPWLPRLVGAAALLILMAHELPLYRLPADQWSRLKYGDHYLAIKNMGQELGRLLQPDETLYQWGIEDGLYFYSQRRPASGIIFHWPVVFGPLMPGLQARLLADLERSPPEVFVTKWEHISREDQRRHPVVAWFLSHYQFYYQRGPFALYYRPGGRLAARLASGAAKPAK